VLDRARHPVALARELAEVRQHLEVERDRRDRSVRKRYPAVARARLDADLADATVTGRRRARAREVAVHVGDQLLAVLFVPADLADLTADRDARALGLVAPDVARETRRERRVDLLLVGDRRPR
jgi:hypothetical protein